MPLGAGRSVNQRQLLDREWLVGVPNSPDQITVLQWNCIADWAAGAFPKVDPEFLTWKYRKPLIVAECLRADPDIICLQEVDHFDDLDALLPEYDGYFKLKGTSPVDTSRDGGAIFWKRDRFHRSRTVDLHYSTMCLRPEMKQVLMSPDLTLNRSDGSTASIRIVATHLKAKKGFDEERRLQCQAIANFLNKQVVSDLTIVCGDFNTDPNSSAVATLIANTKSMPLQSVYRAVNKKAGRDAIEPKWTTWKIRDEVKKATIDFMFYDRKSSWQPIDIWQIPAESQVDLDVALPCAKYPSDHMSLATKFDLRC